MINNWSLLLLRKSRIKINKMHFDGVKHQNYCCVAAVVERLDLGEHVNLRDGEILTFVKLDN